MPGADEVEVEDLLTAVPTLDSATLEFVNPGGEVMAPLDSSINFGVEVEAPFMPGGDDMVEFKD